MFLLLLLPQNLLYNSQVKGVSGSFLTSHQNNCGISRHFLSIFCIQTFEIFTAGNSNHINVCFRCIFFELFRCFSRHWFSLSLTYSWMDSTEIWLAKDLPESDLCNPKSLSLVAIGKFPAFGISTVTNGGIDACWWCNSESSEVERGKSSEQVDGKVFWCFTDSRCWCRDLQRI